MLKVILLRHGESTFNVANRVQGRGTKTTHSVLTELGKQQAELAGQALAGIELIGALVSPLERAQQTARTILSYQTHPPELHTSEHLLEIDLRIWEGMTFSEVEATYPEQYYNWHNAPDKLCIEGVYPVEELFQQAQTFWEQFLAEYNDQSGTVLIVAHSGINRALISNALGIGIGHYHHLKQSNCGISILNRRGQGWQLESMNITSHLGTGLPSLHSQYKGSRILLVRHGETEWNLQKRFQGQMDIPLNEHGKLQAEKAAELLRQTAIHRAWSSPLSRAKVTAEIILQYHPQVELQSLEDLQEISHGDWEGQLEVEVAQKYDRELRAWQTHPEAVQMPNGENLQDVWQRTKRGWEQILQNTVGGEIVLVCAHDAINKAILCNLFDLSPAHFWDFKQGNGGVTVIDYPNGTNGAPYLQAMNITSHLSGSVLDVTTAGAL